MQMLLLWAGILVVLIGLSHSILGEILIFRRQRSSGIVPTLGGEILKERHVRILWASWHLVTILGWALGGMLIMLALPPGQPFPARWLVRIALIATLACSALVCFATKGRHPGWIGLLLAAILTWLGEVGT